ncbi:polymorphic outer membrane protein middle domain-containing protein [Chlamydiifrater volucris]|uniref:polymorphic outer membrane protein middle domain-containing protein n=1 Tax=Chlamydiifrater volucris TaxID=2681470 RepID=UPI001BCCC701|nr:polymorphic outer membrane protein middle domain-containing protein [Chlamydiifrater volucris]
MRKRQSLYLVALALLTNLATCQGSALPDNASLIENAFDTVEKDGVTIHTMNRDFTVSSFIETILSPYHLMKTPNKVLFQGNGHSFILSYLNLANQLSDSQISRDMTFTNFNSLKIDDSGGMNYVIKTDNLNFSNNNLVSISNNLIPTDANWGGCLYAKDLTFSNNRETKLKSNMAKESGGVARLDQNLYITNNKTFIASSNFAKNGGCFTVTSGNFEAKTNIHKNETVIFDNNCANSQGWESDSNLEFGGGVILQQSGVVSIKKNRSIIFQGNRSYKHGGVAACKNIEIAENSFVLFLSNLCSRGQGGAIYLLGGRLFISSGPGDVIFHKNTSNLQRNAISFKDSNSICQVTAKRGAKVHFNDPIDASNVTSAVVLNSKNLSCPNSGKVVFSLLGQASKNESSNGTSKIQKLQQEDGIIVVKDGATLACRTLSQTGGWLVLGAKGAFGTYATTGGSNGAASIVLSNLAVDISSLLSSDQDNSIPTLIIDNGTSENNNSTDNISVSGPIYLTDENLALYEHDSRMSSSIKSVKLLALKKALSSTSKINVDDMDLTTQPSHYGYQGSWQLFWENADAESSPESRNGENIQSYLVGSWIPNGQYLPNPKIEGKILADSVIVSNFAITSFFESIYQQDRNDLHFLNPFKEKRWKYDLQGNFISSIHPSPTKMPFRHKFSGFSTSISAYSSFNNQLGIAISKISCQTDHKDFDHQVRSPLLSAAIFSNFYPQKSFLTEIRGALSISKSDNTFENNEYKVINLPEKVLPYYDMLKKDGIFLSQDENKTINVPSAKFTSHILSTRWDFFLKSVPCKIFGTPILTQLFPFCSIQAFFSDFSNFKNRETTHYDRTLKQKNSAMHLLLPAGARLNIPFRFLGNFTQTKISCSYVPLAYKKDLILKGSLPELPDASWETSNSNFPRNSAKCILAQEITFKDAVKINASYSLHYIYSSFLQSASVGIQTIF